ncbi:MAG: glycosyltransferase family 39 protein [Caldilineaceae bacterium]
MKFHWNYRVQTALVMLCLFVATWTPRVTSLKRSVTVDERKWLARSANFYHAVWQGDFPPTLQSGHPGVPIMWAGTLGFIQLEPAYARLATTSTGDGEDIETWLHQHGSHTPLEMLVRGRWWVVLAIACMLTVGYLPLQALFGASAAALITLFVAWDPFMLALSRQLHPDSLVANLTYLAALYFLVWLYANRARRFLRLSGVVMGLAWLTKVPAILLAPAGVLLVLFELGRAKQGSLFPLKAWLNEIWQTQRLLIIGIVAWGLLAVAAFVVFWPAMWHGPIFTLRNMAEEMGDYVEGHVSGNYFLGRTLDDPGPLFYPLAYLFRMTPATLLGLLAALFCFWQRARPFDNRIVRRSAVGFAVFAAVFMLGMTFGGKKFDRYVLPVFPLLDVVAVLGWFGLAEGVVRWWQGRSPRLAPATGGSLLGAVVLVPTLLLHGIFGFIHYPEYLTYFNPLIPSTVVPRVMMVGWGEGLDVAADWLNQQPNADNLRIASTYGDGPLSYFLHTKQPVQSFWRPDFWFNSDYAVLYVNQWQRRDLIPELVDYLSDQTPAYVVRLHGLEMARIYAMRGKTPPAFSGVYTDNAVNFANQIRLAAYAIGTRTFLTGDHFIIRLYLQSLAPLTKNYVIALNLIGPDGSVVAQSVGAPGGEPATTWPVQDVRYDHHEFTVPDNAPTGEYQVLMSIYDPAAPNRQLPVGSSAATLGEHSHLITSLQIRSARSYAVQAQWGDVQVTQLQHEPKIKPDQPFFVDATAIGKVDGSRKISLRVVDGAGKTWAQADTVLVASSRVELTLPADAPSGSYNVVAVVYDPKTLAPIPDQAGNFTTVLTQIEYGK